MRRWLKKRNNQGFSLTEVLVSLLITSIVVLAISIMMSFGSRMYAEADTETKLQREAQIAINQITEIMMKAKDYKYYDPTSFASCSGSALLITTNREENSTADQENYYAIILDSEDQRLLFQKTNYATLQAIPQTADSWLQDITEEEINSITPSLLASYIMEFSVTPSIYLPTSSDKVQIYIKLKLHDKTFSTFSTIDLRNR